MDVAAVRLTWGGALRIGRMPARWAPNSRSGVPLPLRRRRNWRLAWMLLAAGWLRRRLIWSLSVLLLVAPLYLTFHPAPAAYGSCVSATPRRSPDAFTGVVLSTRSQGRVATVRLETGVLVEVVGTPNAGNGATSVDRTYQVGGRYEIHPVNGASPFLDNACTATRLLALMPPPPKPQTTSAIGWPVVAGGVILLGSVGVAAGWHVWRRRG